MPCVAGDHCKLPELTPSRPGYTNRKCRICNGYLHGTCGVKDLLSNNELKRICGGPTCCDAQTQQQSSGGVATNGKGREKAGPVVPKPTSGKSKTKKGDTPGGGSLIDLWGRSSGASSKKKGCGEKRGSYSLETKSHALELMQNKNMKLVHVSRQLKIPERTLRNFKAQAAEIKAAMLTYHTIVVYLRQVLGVCQHPPGADAG